MAPLQIRIEGQAGGVTMDVFVATKIGQVLSWLEIDSGNPDPLLIAPHLAEHAGITDDGPHDIDFQIVGYRT
jgi:hypothetical protein